MLIFLFSTLLRTLLHTRHSLPFCLYCTFPRPTPRPSQTTSSRPSTTKATTDKHTLHTIQRSRLLPTPPANIRGPLAVDSSVWVHDPGFTFFLLSSFLPLSIYFAVSYPLPPAGSTLISAVHIPRDKNKSEKKYTRCLQRKSRSYTPFRRLADSRGRSTDWWAQRHSTSCGTLI